MNDNTTEKKQRADEMFGTLNNQHDKPLARLIDGRGRKHGTVKGDNWTGRPLQWDARDFGRRGHGAYLDISIYGTDEAGALDLVGEMRISTETETVQTHTGEDYKETHATVFLDRELFLDALLTDARGAKPGWCVVQREQPGARWLGLPHDEANAIAWQSHNPSLITAALDAYCALVG